MTRTETPTPPLLHYRPSEDGRFTACCGGYRRWELVWRGDRPLWQLSSDWGQATVAGLVTPNAPFRLDVELDLSELPQGHLAVALCTRLRVGKPGIDGLPFHATTAFTVRLSHASITVDDGHSPTRTFVAPPALQAGLVRLTLARATSPALTVLLDSAPLAPSDAAPPAADDVEPPSTPALAAPEHPCYVLLSGNSGAEDPRGRFGDLTLTV